MTIIAILLAFALCHFIRELGQFRKNGWVAQWVGFCNDAFGKLPGWQDVLGFLVLFLVPLIVLLLVNQVFISVLGSTGAFLLAIIVLIYTFGPRDLDTEVAGVIGAEDEESRRRALGDFLEGEIPEEETDCRSRVVESVFCKALRRWFGIIFWFALLGIAGAFLYRLADWMANCDFGQSAAQKALFRRMLQIMDWPAAQLMTLSLAIATDFDSVFAAWKKFHDEQGHGLFEGDNGFLLASARSIVMTGHAARDGYAELLDGPMIGLQQAMDLVWRILGVWMTTLALLLLVGVIT